MEKKYLQEFVNLFSLLRSVSDTLDGRPLPNGITDKNIGQYQKIIEFKRTE